MPTQEHDATGVVIDAASYEDLQTIIKIDCNASGEAKPEFWLECYKRQGAEPNSTFLVAKSDGKIAGFTIGTIKTWEFGSPACGWVETIIVAPEFRGQSIGTQLFDAVVSHFRSNGITTVRTMLDISDHALMSFFRFQGMSAGPFIELEMQSE